MPARTPSVLTILRSYATKKNPERLPPSLLFSHTPAFITIFDCFPKALFHLLVLPRPTPAFSVLDLTSLHTVLRHRGAQELLLGLRKEAQSVRASVRAEMRKRYGFEWDVWIGFHAVPSMECVARA